MIQAIAPAPHSVLTGANPSPPAQPQEKTYVDDTQAEAGIKPQLSFVGGVAKEGGWKSFHQLHKMHIKSTQQTR